MNEKVENKLPQRKDLRLKQYDYSSAGAYFVTICIQDRKCILSDIIAPVGDGALDVPFDEAYYEPQIRLTKIGKIIEKNLLSSENIAGVTIDRYVIMPDHIHVIIFLDPNKYKKCPNETSESFVNGTSRAPSPTNEMLPRVVSAFKRFCNREIGCNIFQRGYIEHIIRDPKDYETKVNYIYKNPIRRYYGGLNESCFDPEPSNR
ncbi:MAG: hypothetical protein IJX19_02145 [Clostridia bacterium]|nr:hypothetical protein [Clostridia bacterium]